MPTGAVAPTEDVLVKVFVEKVLGWHIRSKARTSNQAKAHSRARSPDRSPLREREGFSRSCQISEYNCVSGRDAEEDELGYDACLGGCW